MSDRVTCTIEGGVADVRLNRAEKMNALDGAMFTGLAEMGERLKTNPAYAMLGRAGVLRRPRLQPFRDGGGRCGRGPRPATASIPGRIDTRPAGGMGVAGDGAAIAAHGVARRRLRCARRRYPHRCTPSG
jgi:hypothetical protein